MQPHKKTDNFVETKLDDELVLMNLHTGRFNALAGTGLAIWNLIDGTRDLSAMKAELAQCYNTTVEACGPDVDSFLATLETAGFVALG